MISRGSILYEKWCHVDGTLYKPDNLYVTQKQKNRRIQTTLALIANRKVWTIYPNVTEHSNIAVVGYRLLTNPTDVSRSYNFREPTATRAFKCEVRPVDKTKQQKHTLRNIALNAHTRKVKVLRRLHVLHLYRNKKKSVKKQKVVPGRMVGVGPLEYCGNAIVVRTTSSKTTQ